MELDPGLNCFTGQTGAGKSLVIGALEMLLGLRRPGYASQGRRRGPRHRRFSHRQQALREQIAAITDLPVADEPEMVIARRIYESGRTSGSINGNPITGQMLKLVGEVLVDVHGQHDAQYLLKPMNQLHVIDDFGGSADLRSNSRNSSAAAETLVAQQKELTASRTLRRQQLELYQFPGQGD